MFGFGARAGLKVGGRKRDALVEGVLRQVGRVRGVLGENTPVRGALCFVDSDWPLLGGAFSVQDVRVLWPKRLVREIEAAADQGINALESSRLLASVYPPA